MPDRRIVIAGAGIIGASIAYHLAKRGAAVTVLDAVGPAAGATSKSFAWINATFSKRPRGYFALNALGIAGWRRLEQELAGALDVQWGGSVFWTPPGPESDELRASVSNHQASGYRTHLIDRPELRRLLPKIAFDEVGAACECPDEGAVDPIEAVMVLLRRAQEFGAEIRYPDEADIQYEGTLVLAAGVGSRALAELAGVAVPLKDSPGVLIHTGPLPKLIDRIVIAPGVHFRQKPDGRIVAGGEIVAGVGTAGANSGDAAQIFERVARYLPQIRGAAIERVTLGNRVMPLDEYPIVGFSAIRPNIYVAVTHSGVTLAPIIGELAAIEILDSQPAAVLTPYRPSRFSQRSTAIPAAP